MFSLIIPGRPIHTEPAVISLTQYAFTVPTFPPFTHLVVFLLPNQILPLDTAAAIYLQLPGSASPGSFTFLGAIANEKQSAVFRINGAGGGGGTGAGAEETKGAEDGGVPADDVMVDEIAPGDSTFAIGGEISDTSGVPEMVVGVAIESAGNVAAQLEALRISKMSRQAQAQAQDHDQDQGQAPQGLQVFKRPLSTKMLAQRIIENAFNFLASFSTTRDGEEMVPLKSMREWWSKFEKRLELDPSFLEREGGA
jgi:hypothetical protein